VWWRRGGAARGWVEHKNETSIEMSIEIVIEMSKKIRIIIRIEEPICGSPGCLGSRRALPDQVLHMAPRLGVPVLPCCLLVLPLQVRHMTEPPIRHSVIDLKDGPGC
jgi:hypothetical protein